MKRTDWVTRLVRCRLHSAAPLPLEERAAVAQAWRELNRIGINLNQATRALNASVMVESGLDVAREAARLRRENEELRQRSGGDVDLVGQSSAIVGLRQAIERVAPTNSRVLISGPAGVGKEQIGRAHV